VAEVEEEGTAVVVDEEAEEAEEEDRIDRFKSLRRFRCS
jgi:hypothetical protein